MSNNTYFYSILIQCSLFFLQEKNNFTIFCFSIVWDNAESWVNQNFIQQQFIQKRNTSTVLSQAELQVRIYRTTRSQILFTLLPPSGIPQQSVLCFLYSQEKINLANFCYFPKGSCQTRSFSTVWDNAGLDSAESWAKQNFILQFCDMSIHLF